jgi:hypothetical protein
MALLVFLLSLGAIAWLPGRALLALLRVRAGLLEQAVVSLALGLVGSAAAYWLLAFLGLRPLFWLWPPAAGLLLVRLREAGPRRAPEEGARGDLAAVGALVVLAVAALAFAPFYYRNLAPTRDGGLTFYALPDLVLHLSIAQELTHAVPPTVPFMPGTPLSYHYGADLVLALFSAVPGLGLPDVAARFVPTLFFALALGAAFVAARAFGLGRAGATACAFLVVFGEDFSFLPALLRGAPPGEPWAVTMLQAPTVVSLFMMNPMLPALGLLFASLACLARFCQGGGSGHLVVAAALAAGLIDVKVFAAAHLLAALAIAALLALWRMRDRRLLWAALALAALVLPRLILTASGEVGPTRVTVGLSSFVPDAVVNLGLRGTVLGAAVFDLLERGRLTPWSLLAVLAASVLYLALAFGLRCLGLPGVLRALGLRDPREAHRLVLASFVLLGPVLALGLQILPASAARGPEAYNNAVWFLVQSKYLAWVFAAERLGAWWLSGSTLRRAGLVAGVLALSLPSTLQFMRLQFAEGPPALDRRLVEVAAFLRAHEAPGRVVVAPESVGGPLISLAPCRSPLPDALFPHFRGRLPGIRERVDAFWDAWDYGTPIEAPLRALGPVDLVVARPRRASPAGVTEVFRNDALAVYRVARP